jgi:predicted glycoside hydrolase/deacetylase ChbG (UPF0249 family)
LIVTADDLGVCEERNRGIIHCIQHGVITSTSLMCNAPAAASGIRAIESLGPWAQGLVGLHLNLTEGSPLSPISEVPSLLRAPLSADSCSSWESSAHSNGKPCFLGKIGFSIACAQGTVDPKEVVQEARAQLEWFRTAAGRLPSHIDGHQHCHIEPTIADSLAQLFSEYGIQSVRIPEEHDYEHLQVFCARCKEVQASAPSARASYERHGLATPHAFLGCSLCGLSYTPVDFLCALDKQVAFLSRRADSKCLSVPESEQLEGRDGEFDNEDSDMKCQVFVIEAMCHPGFASLGQWDEFTASLDRESELRTLCDPSLREGLRLRGVSLCSHSSSSLCGGMPK